MAPQESWDIGGHKIVWCGLALVVRTLATGAWCQLSRHDRSRDTTPRRRRRAPLRSLAQAVIYVKQVCVLVPVTLQLEIVAKSRNLIKIEKLLRDLNGKILNRVIVEMT